MDMNSLNPHKKAYVIEQYFTAIKEQQYAWSDMPPWPLGHKDMAWWIDKALVTFLMSMFIILTPSTIIEGRFVETKRVTIFGQDHF